MKILTLPGNPTFNGRLRNYFETYYPDEQQIVDVKAEYFASGEPSIQVLGNVRNAKTFIVQSSSGSYPLLRSKAVEARLKMITGAWAELSDKDPKNKNLRRLVFGLTGMRITDAKADADKFRNFIARLFKKSVNDDFMHLLSTLDALDRAGSGEKEVVVPFLAYMRQDRKDKPRVPITARLTADMIQLAAGNKYGGLITSELHVSQEQGFFRGPVDDLPMHYIQAVDIQVRLDKKGLSLDDVMLLSPDIGGIGRVKKVADALNSAGMRGWCKTAIYDKSRMQGQKVVSQLLQNTSNEGRLHTSKPLRNLHAIFIDDMIDSANTASQAGQSVINDFGAKSVEMIATHAVLTSKSLAVLRKSPFESMTVTDTLAIPPHMQCLVDEGRLRQISVAPYFAEAMRSNMYENGSVSKLLSVEEAHKLYDKAVKTQGRAKSSLPGPSL